MKESKLTAWIIVALSLVTIILAITVFVLIKYQMPKGMLPALPGSSSGREVLPENIPPPPSFDQGGQEGNGLAPVNPNEPLPEINPPEK